MTRKERAAFNALKKIGAPVFERSDVGAFVISAENNDETQWADYYMEFGINRDSEIPGVHPDICSILDKYNIYAEWENPGALIVFED